MENNQFNTLAGTYYRKIQIYMKKVFKDLGISFDDGIILLNVANNPGTTQDSIAKLLVLDTGAVTRSLKSLESNKYVKRQVDKSNQRKKLAFITSKGETIVNKINLAMSLWDDAIFSSMEEKEKETIINSLQILQSHAEKININDLIK